MNKITETIKKNYIYINLTFLFLSIYIILFPIIEKLIKPIFPDFNECVYLKATGKPCPLCGGTRYIKGLPTVLSDITYLFHPFGIIMIVIIAEFIFRIYNIITRKKEKSTKWVNLDLLIHIIIANLFLIYEILFILIN